jgi:hypothetical protein
VIQYNVGSAGLLHQGVNVAWYFAAGRYNLNMAEAADYGTGIIARQKNWAVAMAGAYVMVLGMDIANTPVSDLSDLGRLRAFMESTDFPDMAPHDELAHAATQYVLAQPGNRYIAYSANLANGAQLGIKAMQAGTYYMRWLDTVTGATVIDERVAVAAGDNAWNKPVGFSNEVALYIYAVIFKNSFENNLGHDRLLLGEHTTDTSGSSTIFRCS